MLYVVNNHIQVYNSNRNTAVMLWWLRGFQFGPVWLDLLTCSGVLGVCLAGWAEVGLV